MTCRYYVKLPLGVYIIYDVMDTKILKTPHDLLVHLATLEKDRNTDTITLNKYRGDTFSESFTYIFKAKLLQHLNKGLF